MTLKEIDKNSLLKLNSKAEEMYNKQKLDEDPNWDELPTTHKRLWVGEAAQELGYNSILFEQDE